jgi:hypothetical protein
MIEAQPLDSEENPAWVLEPPDTAEIAPPVDTLAQELPFSEITWQNFERLLPLMICKKSSSLGQPDHGMPSYPSSGSRRSDRSALRYRGAIEELIRDIKCWRKQEPVIEATSLKSRSEIVRLKTSQS